MNQITHTYGVASTFIFSEGKYYIRSSLGHLLGIMNEEGEVVEELFPLHEIPGGTKFRNIGGVPGGVQKIGSKIYLMNSLEPKIYVYDTATKKAESIWVDAYKKEYEEFDIGNKELVEFFTSLNSVRMNGDLFVIEHGDEKRLAFTSAFKSNSYLHVLDEQLQLAKEVKLEEAVIGHDDGTLYQHDMETSDGVIFLRSTDTLN